MKRLRVDGRHRHRHRDGHLDPARARRTPRDGLVRAYRVRAVTHHQPVRDAAGIVVKRTGRDRYTDGGRLARRRRALRREVVRRRSPVPPGARSGGRQGRPRGVQAVVLAVEEIVLVLVLVLVVVVADRIEFRNSFGS